MKPVRTLLLCILVAFILGCCDSPPSQEVNNRAQEAIATGNPGLCENFTYNFEKNECYKQVAVGLQNSDVCKSIKGDNTTRDSCYLNVAVNTTTFGACMDIEEDFTKTMCIGQVAGDKVNNIKSDLESGWDKVKNFFGGNNTKACEYQETQEKKDSCFKYAAINSNNHELCSNIKTDEVRVDCYRKLAVNNKDTYMCMQLATQEERDKCFYNAAFSGDNPNFCRGIKDSYQKEKCYRQAGINTTVAEGYY